MKSFPRPRSSAAFTLLELLISAGIAMVLASVATTAYIQFSRMVARAEARMAMFSSAQRLYIQLSQAFSSIQPSCAMVVSTTSNTEIRLIFMRAKEDVWDFDRPTAPRDWINSDLTWQELVWDRGSQTLKSAVNSAGTASRPVRSFVAAAGSLGTFSGKTFNVLPQPRRELDPLNPINSPTKGLNDNIYFPNSATPAVSVVNPAADIGDYTDLENNLVPVLTRMSDLSFEMICHDGSTVTIDDSATTAPPRVFQGVWLDGRMASTLTAAPAFATSEVAKRPKLLRMRFTLNEPKIGFSSTFSFTFGLPALSP